MSYTNSKLVDCKVMSPNHSGQRTHAIDTITPHCVVGQLVAENIGYCFDDTARKASCNYGIGTEGRVCLIVDEANRSWCTSSSANDQRAITIECASDKAEPYAMNDKVYNKLIELCVDICKRNGKTKLLWFADKDKTLNYTPAKDEMLISVHRWFANKSCPGNWLYSRLGHLASEVTKRLGGTTSAPTTPSTPTTTPSTGEKKYYRVRKSWSDTASQLGAYEVLENAKKACKDGYTVYDWNGTAVYPVKAPTPAPTPAPAPTFKPYMVRIDVNSIHDKCLNIRQKPDASSTKMDSITRNMSLTIVAEEKDAKGNTWGLLKSYEKKRNGWINLYYVEKVK